MHTPLKGTEGRYLIGYARVSTSDQNLDMQIDALVAAGVPRERIYTDKASGRNMRRRGWEALKRDVREGDCLVVREINRLGRDISDLFAVLKWLHDEGADLVVLTMDLDTRTPTGRLIFGILGLVSQWERELIVERSIAGQKAARERGRMPGARPKLNPQQQKEALRRVGKGEPIKIIAESYGVSRQAIYNLKWSKGK